MRTVRTADPTVRRQIYAGIGQVRRDEGVDFTTATINQIIDCIWPSVDGWQILAIEPDDEHLLFLLEHPAHGIGSTLIWTPLTSVHPDYLKPVTVSTWDAIPRAARDQYLFDAHHAHGPTRLDLLEAIDADGMNKRDARALIHLTACSAFLDETTKVMLGLGSHEQLLRDARIVIGRL